MFVLFRTRVDRLVHWLKPSNNPNEPSKPGEFKGPGLEKLGSTRNGSWGVGPCELTTSSLEASSPHILVTYRPDPALARVHP